ncbi:thiamine-phosphate kinase [Nitratiruptor sp. YY09-18]|uniref:thiamine-phosphate kinase n=1 Tax=Nitratiruptor sp. YY09-18 TaxID=2724901 RepID=UPI00191570AB|nr:thiamine-phosphate kinase [Nitratiruptor sp. YY09-18]BCD68315.1 thiamine-monophosphate kinase [Nitratiruptor sp. YY09-18]
MNREFYYISLFNNKYIGDDGAVIGKEVYSADAFCEDIHFKREWFDLATISKKAMLVNISDAIAMNAQPMYALVSVQIPRTFHNNQLRQIAQGLQEAADEYECEIIGGDTVAGEKLDFSITLISHTKRAILRKPVREGYLLAFTGELGSVAKDLRRALRFKKVAKNSKFARPRLRQKFMQKAARHIKAAMDISDGLFDDLAKLSAHNKKIGYRFLRSISRQQGCSGEEYELLFAFDPREKRAIEAIAKKTRTKITIFAKAQRRRYRNMCKTHHF